MSTRSWPNCDCRRIGGEGVKGRAPAYTITAEQLVRGLFDGTSIVAMLLDAACCNLIDLHAPSSAWNDILWLLFTEFVEDGVLMFDASELPALKAVLPVEIH